MASECYYSKCPYHANNEVPPEEGPFCHEPVCEATVLELQKYQQENNNHDEFE